MSCAHFPRTLCPLSKGIVPTFRIANQQLTNTMLCLVEAAFLVQFRHVPLCCSLFTPLRVGYEEKPRGGEAQRKGSPEETKPLEKKPNSLPRLVNNIQKGLCADSLGKGDLGKVVDTVGLGVG